MLTLHPLSLKFLTDLDYSQLCTQLTEAISWQWLRQYVSNLLLSADVFNVQFPVSNTLPNEMKPHIYMFTTFMEDGILTEGNGRLAVHLEDKGCALLAFQLGKQLRQPNTLAGRRRPCNILSFARG